jgi:O-antigen ligase
MSQIEIVVPGRYKNKYFMIVATIVVTIMLAITIGLIGSVSPLIILAAIILFSISVLFTALIGANFIVILVAFIIYTNTAVVLIRFHSVTPILGYALPLLLLLPFFWGLIYYKRKIKVNFVFVLMLLYFSILLLGSAFSIDISLAIPNVFNYVAEGLGLYFLLTNTIRIPSLLKNIIWAMLIGGAIIGGLSLYQQVTGTFENNYWGYAQVIDEGFTTGETLQGKIVQTRASGPIGEKNRFAQVMLMMVPIGLFHAWGEQSGRLRFIAFLLTGLIFIGGSLAFSRGAQVGVLLLIAIMTFMRYIKVQQLLIILLSIVMLMLAFPQNTVRFNTLGALFSSEEEGGLRSADGSIQGRATEMLAAMLVFMDHPVIGVGPGMFGYEMAEYAKIVSLRHITTTREAHSLYLGVAAETGTLGFVTLMGIFIATLYRLTKVRSYWLERNNIKMANLCTGFFLSIISYMTTGFFLHFAYIRFFWLFLALAIVASEFRESDVTVEMEAVGQINL